ncbi:MAG TPA: ComF family protein [Bacteroidia bacterium]
MLKATGTQQRSLSQVKGNFFTDFVSLVFPRVCTACGRSLNSHEDCICTLCHYRLPKTNYHLQPINPVVKLFWGRVPVRAAGSYYSFSKGGSVQKLVHQLKYRGRKEIGITIGKFYGAELRESEIFSSSQVIVPVPLHAQKLKRRGHNQSDLFAQGLASGLDIPHDPANLVRVKASETQTRRSRFERWKNVESVFKVSDPAKLEGKNILLVDDVITTGSTLEACAQELLKVPGTTVSVATIAYAQL